MKTRLMPALRTIASAGMLGTVLVLAPAAPAQAAPSNCSGAYNLVYYNTYSVYCGKGDGEYRARARCYRIGRDTYTTRYGNWLRPGGTHSTAYCQSNEEVSHGGWEFR